MNVLVSILIPVYNREKIISDTISCAVNQTHKSIEIIICDNCSTDNTWEILCEWAAKDSRIKIFQNKKNLGPVLNWEKCIEKANGKYAKILWSDDLIANTFIEHTLALFDDKTAFVLTGIRIFDSDTNLVLSESFYQNQVVYTMKEYLNDCLINNRKGFPVSPGCALFRTIDLKRSLIIDIPNNHNLDFKYYGAGNDLLFFLITATQYEQIKTVNHIESFFISHKDSISVANNNILFIYYEWARFYFISKYQPDLLPKYKTRLFLKKLRNNSYVNIYKLIKGCMDKQLLFYMIFYKIKRLL
jgi:glycosyltransferase involved in cell wall biosynthesis